MYLLLPMRMRVVAATFHAEHGNASRSESIYSRTIASLEKLVAERPELIEARSMLADIYENCRIEKLRNRPRARELKEAAKS